MGSMEQGGKPRLARRLGRGGGKKSKVCRVLQLEPRRLADLRTDRARSDRIGCVPGRLELETAAAGFLEHVSK